LTLLAWQAFEKPDASSARGWGYDPKHPDASRAWNGVPPVGNYLDYSEHNLRNPKRPVHACCTPWVIDSTTSNYHYLPTTSASFATVSEAQEWIAAEYFRRMAEERSRADG
jgi:hypothetical protein